MLTIPNLIWLKTSLQVTKNQQKKKTLLIEGARRIGKSTIAEEFGKNEYESYILLDFNKASKKVKDAFDETFSLY